jgi:Calcineurin-like phosphoesterase
VSILQGLCGAKTDLYAAWKGETGDDRLFLAAFANNSWTSLGTIPGNSSIGPALAMIGDTLYASWKGEQDDERLFYAAFSGKSWDSQAAIPGNSSVGPALAAVGGVLYAAWKGESYDQRLFFSSLQNGAWVPQEQIPNVASSIGPALAGLGTELYAAWKGKDSDQRMYYAVFDGKSWSGQKPIPGAATSVGPSLAVIGTTLYAAWKGEGSDQRLWYASFDGTNWSGQNQIPGTASSLGPALAAFNGDLYAMWKGAGTDQSLWYASFANSKWSGQQTLPGNSGQDIIRFVWIPDIHLEQTTLGQPATWITQAKWISSNQFAYNIQGVFCAGDVQISISGQDDLPQDIPMAWNEGFSIIDAMGKPYLTCAGNHDYDDIDDTTSFDQNVGYQRIFQKPWYVGYWEAPGVAPVANPGTPAEPPGGYPSKATLAIRFDIGARQFLVIALEFLPRQGALDWAATIINQFPTYDVIILDHGYMTMLGNLFTANGDDNNAFGPSETYNPGFTTGVQVNAWAKTFPNVRLVLCGHDIPSGQQSGIANVSHRIDPSAGGHNLLGIYADYQFLVAPDQLTSQVILLLEVGGQQVTVRGFNTNTNTERSTPYPFSLPWS